MWRPFSGYLHGTAENVSLLKCHDDGQCSAARVLLNCKPEMVGMGSYDLCFCCNELAASEKTIVYTQLRH